jgi:hypothetical protein
MSRFHKNCCQSFFRSFGKSAHPLGKDLSSKSLHSLCVEKIRYDELRKVLLLSLSTFIVVSMDGLSMSLSN